MSIRAILLDVIDDLRAPVLEHPTDDAAPRCQKIILIKRRRIPTRFEFINRIGLGIYDANYCGRVVEQFLERIENRVNHFMEIK